MPDYRIAVASRRRDGHRETFAIDCRTLSDSSTKAGVASKKLRNAALQGAAQQQVWMGRGIRIRRSLDIEIRFSNNNAVYLQQKRYELAHKLADAGGEPDATLGQVSRCRALFEMANIVLPRSLREDALDEWMDEIQCAAEEGQSCGRRALSILIRSLPKQALRARFPIRYRRS